MLTFRRKLCREVSTFMEKTKKEKIWNWAGLAFMLLAGSGLHFVYDLWPDWLTAWIAPVNESIFEHTKLLFFPPLVWMVILYLFAGKRGRQFYASRIYPTLIGTGVMVVSYYLYSGIIGDHFMAADILIFVISVLVNWLLTQKHWTVSPLPGFIAVFGMLAFYLLAAYIPPRIAFFRDEQTGKYGRG